MRTLIIPCAGSRKIDKIPLFLNTYPDNQLLLLKAIECIYPESYDRIVISILEKDNTEFHAIEKINNANNGRYNLEFALFNEPTNGPAETVYKTLQKANIKGEFAVRDSHAYISIITNCCGNFVAGLDLTKYEKTIENLRNKSFMILNEHGHILDIVEKHFCSDVISAGFYGFKSDIDFKTAFEHLSDPNYNIKKLYISHVISYLIGYYQRIFHRVEVNTFEDWSTNFLWKKIQKQHSLCLINMDCINFSGITKQHLIKLTNEGMSFIGYSCKDTCLSDYNITGINILGIVPCCPVTNSTMIIGKDEDVEKLLLEV